eukprot:COSAG02_NODE_25236_length_665_cov_0.724382_1_plen_101_part_00
MVPLEVQEYPTCAFSVPVASAPAHTESFADEVFGVRADHTKPQPATHSEADLTAQARGVWPPPNDPTIPYKYTVRTCGRAPLRPTTTPTCALWVWIWSPF